MQFEEICFGQELQIFGPEGSDRRHDQIDRRSLAFHHLVGRRVLRVFDDIPYDRLEFAQIVRIIDEHQPDSGQIAERSSFDRTAEDRDRFKEIDSFQQPTIADGTSTLLAKEARDLFVGAENRVLHDEVELTDCLHTMSSMSWSLTGTTGGGDLIPAR